MSGQYSLSKHLLLIRRLGVALLIALFAGNFARAQSYPPSQYYGCANSSCHKNPVILPAVPPDPLAYHVAGILTHSFSDGPSVTAFLRGRSGTMKTIGDSMDLMGRDDGTPLLQFLRDVNSGVLKQSNTSVSAGSTVTLPAGISAGATTSTSLTFKNFRGADMPFSLALTGSVGQRPGDFELMSDCPAQPLAPSLDANVAVAAIGGTTLTGDPTLDPGICTFTVLFHPADDTTDITRTATVTLDVTLADGLNPAAVAFTISGAASAPLVVASVPAPYVTPKLVPKDETLEIVDRLGDAFRLCPDASSAPFRKPGDYSLPTLSTDSNGCGIVPVVGAGALPRTLDIPVRFIPSTDGPSNATYLIRRLDLGNTPTGRTYTVDLRGNQGEFITTAPAALFASPSPGAGTSVEETGHATADDILTVSSRGTGPVTFIGTLLGGSHPADYTLVASDCTVLPAYTDGGPDQQCTYTLRFDPSDVGARDATFTVTTDTASTTIDLRGEGKREPRLVVTEGGATVAANAILDFGHQTLGGLYRPRVLKLANVGTTDALQIGLTGSLPSGFTANAGADCTSLPSASSCTLIVTFAPPEPQSYTGTLTIQSTAPGSSSPTSFPLAVTGSGDTTAIPVLEWQDGAHQPISSVEFGDVDAGASGTTTVKVHNVGKGGVQVHLVNVTGLDASQFGLSASPNCQPEQDLYEGDDCDLVVTFTPAGTGAKSAVLQLGSGGSTLAPIPVHGNARASSASVLTVSAASLSFAPTESGTQSQPLRVTLVNGGAAGITVQGLDITGAFALTAGTCGAPPIALPAGGQCDVMLVFRPGAQGPASGRMHIQSDAATTPGDVALDGNGTEAPDLSSGGCSLARHGGRIDPTLWALVLGALGVLAWRVRTRRRRQETSR